MNLLNKLWTDDEGVILSAETVMLGTIGVLAMTAGVGVMGNAMNEELADVSRAFRSFDQSFQVTGYRVDSSEMRSSGSSNKSGSTTLAMKTGSGFTQQSAQSAVDSLTMQPMTAQIVSGLPNVAARESEADSPTEESTAATQNTGKSREELQRELKQLLEEYSRLQAAQQQAADGRPAKTY